MAYKDNYPNGYKSGYSSWDDPDRKDYSPSGEERGRRSAMAASEERDRVMSDYEAGRERERQHQQRIQEQREREEWKEHQSREKSAEHMKMYTESINYIF